MTATLSPRVGGVGERQRTHRELGGVDHREVHVGVEVDNLSVDGAAVLGDDLHALHTSHAHARW